MKKIIILLLLVPSLSLGQVDCSKEDDFNLFPIYCSSKILETHCINKSENGDTIITFSEDESECLEMENKASNYKGVGSQLSPEQNAFINMNLGSKVGGDVIGSSQSEADGFKIFCKNTKLGNLDKDVAILCLEKIK